MSRNLGLKSLLYIVAIPNGMRTFNENKFFKENSSTKKSHTDLGSESVSDIILEIKPFLPEAAKPGDMQYFKYYEKKFLCSEIFID